MIHRSHKTQGFTILELIVALGVTVLLVFMISALFTSTSDGVALGMAVSDVIGAGRAIGDQIESDAQQMITPVNNGVLVIVCQEIDMPYMERRVEKTRKMRSDQVMWLRNIGANSARFGSMPMTPLNESTYSSVTTTQLNETSAVRIWYGHGQKADQTGTSVSGFGMPGPNRYANQLALSRHALFLNGSLDQPKYNHANGATATSAVNPAYMHLPNGANGQLKHGITDVAWLRHHASGATTPPAFVGDNSSGGDTLWLGDSGYGTKAMNYMFLGNNRIWLNPFPQTNPQDDKTWASSAQIAQMHPLLMDNVSDFIVEFAADAVDDAFNTATFDGEPDKYGGVPTGEIIWYSLANNDNSNSRGAPAWDTRGLFSPVVSVSGGVGYVFRHGLDNQVHWPYMIRIRYRVHDARGDLLGDKSPEPDGTNVGRWFEQIIKVNRE